MREGELKWSVSSVLFLRSMWSLNSFRSILMDGWAFLTIFSPVETRLKNGQF